MKNAVAFLWLRTFVDIMHAWKRNSRFRVPRVLFALKLAVVLLITVNFYNSSCFIPSSLFVDYVQSSRRAIIAETFFFLLPLK